LDEFFWKKLRERGHAPVSKMEDKLPREQDVCFELGESLMETIVFELCAETVDACLAAGDGGAHRIELCTALSEGD
jgi:hypothetical protein